MAASSTMYTTLSVYSSTGTAGYTKLCPIKDYPDLGGAPEQVETTTLDNNQATFVNGVQQVDRLEFTANYDKDDYKKVKDLETEASEEIFRLSFGSTSGGSELGAFYWKGIPSVWVLGGGVNGVREMRISISLSAEITDQDLSTTSY